MLNEIVLTQLILSYSIYYSYNYTINYTLYEILGKIRTVNFKVFWIIKNKITQIDMLLSHVQITLLSCLLKVSSLSLKDHLFRKATKILNFHALYAGRPK